MGYTINQQQKDLDKAKNYSDGLTIIIKQNMVIQEHQIEANKLANRNNNLLSDQNTLLRQMLPHKITDEDIAFIKEMEEAQPLNESNGDKS